MLRNIFVQVLVCFILAAVLVNTPLSFNIQDVKGAFSKVSEVLSSLNIENIKGRLIEAVDVMVETPLRGEPIDEEYEGDETSVYAVEAGKVIAVGENEEIGRYIRIKHGDQSESLYGNLSDIHVIASANVKKGQIIGIYDNSAGKDFYYSFQEF